MQTVKEYKVVLRGFNPEKAARKLIEAETGQDPEEDRYYLEHTFFNSIKLESVEFGCNEGCFEWIYTFTDNGSLHKWGRINEKD